MYVSAVVVHEDQNSIFNVSFQDFLAAHLVTLTCFGIESKVKSCKPEGVNGSCSGCHSV